MLNELSYLKNNECVLDVGANNGDVTLQLLDMDNKRIVALDSYPEHVSSLRNRFSGNTKVEVVEGDFFDKNAVSYKFDVVLLKEFLNALPENLYRTIFDRALELLKSNGRIVIIDYRPWVVYRHFVFGSIVHPLKMKKHIQNLIRSIHEMRLLSKENLRQYFVDSEYGIESYLYPVDPLNKFHPLSHRMMERFFPGKYMAVISKKQDKHMGDPV
jgi:ubiquinone/menaquinone biosynthesis C-methylase UbiE